MRHLLYFICLLVICCFSLHGENAPERFEGACIGWKHKRLDLISLFLPPNPVILQAGGYYGDETVYFAAHFPDSQIISFEPNPHSFEILHSKTYNIKNIQAYNLALNDCSGVAPFYVCYGSSGKDKAFEYASSLLKPSQCMKIHYQGPVINVECAVLDDWCLQNKIDHIDFLCLNLQGSELQVLKSSPNILDTVTCISIHTNFFPFRVGTTQYLELKNFLERSGFQLLTHWYREGLDGDAIFIKNDYFFNSRVKEYLRNNRVDDRYKLYYEPFFKVYYDLDDVKDTIKDTLKQGLAYEGNIGIIIDQLTKPGSLAIDIGSHIGIHTVTMSRKVGPQGAVIAFEPHKKLYMELLHTLCLNHCNNVIAISKALSDTSKKVLLKDIQIVQGNTQGKGGDWVETIPLDSLKLDNISLIKMDVENYEYFVLKGAKETILRSKPVIIFECWIDAVYKTAKPKKKANFKRVISFIESCGYEIYVIFGNDFLAIPSDATGELAEYKKNFRRLDFDNFDLGY